MSDEASPRARREKRRGPGLASALAGAGLLVVLGFALGVVGGLVLEEPDLLLDYVLGRAEQVEVAGEATPTGDVAARPPSEAGARAGAPEPAAAPRATEDTAGADAEPEAEWIGATPPAREDGAAGAKPPAEAAAPVLAASPAGGFAVQVGAFADPSTAEQLARRLRSHGHPVYVAPSASSDTARWRVRVGPFSSRAEAEGQAARLEREERVSTWVLAESPP